MRVLLPVILLVAATLAGCSDGATDEDGDGLRDRTEKDWPDLIVDYIDRRVRLEGVTSDTKDDDTDDDGLSDFDEFFRKTDPRDNDTDDDGLTDCQEAIHKNRTECEDPEFAGTYDHGYGTNPVRADSDPGPVRYVNQPGRFVDETGTLVDGRVEWGDGLSDSEEVLGYLVEFGNGRTRLVTSNPRDPDSDGDGLEDGEEALVFDSDPQVPDTDGDGCADGQDPWPSAEERYSLGLSTFHLKVDRDSEGSDLVLSGEMVGRRFVAPPAGSIHVDKATDTDISTLTPPPSKGNGCPIRPQTPWARIQLGASDPDPGAASQTLDISSQSPGGTGGLALPSVWWNVRTGEFALDPLGDDRLPTPLRFEGSDAWLDLSPTVVLSQSS